MMEQWEMPGWIVTRDGKTTREVRLLGTSPFWSSLSQPLGRPPTDLYSKTQDYPSGCQCAAGRCITSILPTCLHLLQTSAQTSCPSRRLTGSSVALAIYTSPHLSRALRYLLSLPWFSCSVKGLFGCFHGLHSAHQEDP